jgi:hypothetical protein
LADAFAVIVAPDAGHAYSGFAVLAISAIAAFSVGHE